MFEYPIFLKSYSFCSIEESKPVLPKEPIQPPIPKLIKKNWFEKLILFCDENEDKLINLKRYERYLEQVIKYKNELDKYQGQVREILSETNIKIYREEKKWSTLSQTKLANRSTRETLKGRYEPFFHSILTQKFGDNIFDNLEFTLPNGNAFVPDFAYIDTSTGLCIDIEIDEPYTSDTKVPIHCIGEDDYRNNFFLSKGWFVIRFAEIQIAKYPNQCCDFIKNLIENITDGKEFEQFHFPYQCWSYLVASEMAVNNIRNTY